MTMSDRLVVMRKGRIEGIGSPRDVYDSPSTEFVASFLGASNLLAGRVSDRGGPVATVTLDAGATLRVPVDRLPGADVAVKVGVRPEKISLGGAAGEGRNSLAGRVRVSTFTGVGNQYIVETPWGTEVTVYAQNIGDDAAPRSGEEVTLTWPVEHTFAVRPMEPGASIDSEISGEDSDG